MQRYRTDRGILFQCRTACQSDDRKQMAATWHHDNKDIAQGVQCWPTRRHRFRMRASIPDCQVSPDGFQRSGMGSQALHSLPWTNQFLGINDIESIEERFHVHWRRAICYTPGQTQKFRIHTALGYVFVTLLSYNKYEVQSDPQTST